MGLQWTWEASEPPSPSEEDPVPPDVQGLDMPWLLILLPQGLEVPRPLLSLPHSAALAAMLWGSDREVLLSRKPSLRHLNLPPIPLPVKCPTLGLHLGALEDCGLKQLLSGPSRSPPCHRLSHRPCHRAPSTHRRSVAASVLLVAWSSCKMIDRNRNQAALAKDWTEDSFPGHTWSPARHCS